MARLLEEPYQSPGAGGQGSIKPFFIYINMQQWCLGAGVGAVLTALRAGGWFTSPGFSDASRASRWVGEGSCSLPNSWGCSCFPRCCSVGNYTVNGLVDIPVGFPGSGCWRICRSG